MSFDWLVGGIIDLLHISWTFFHSPKAWGFFWLEGVMRSMIREPAQRGWMSLIPNLNSHGCIIHLFFYLSHQVPKVYQDMTSAMEKQWFGHPRGLATLFFTEMWERFSYYGGRAMLILYMTAAVTADNPGLGLSVVEAGALYALYTSVVYMTNLPGGWIADKFLGARSAVFWGGVLIAAGNLCLALPFGTGSFFAGLGIVAIGTGLLKPNVSTMVGALYGKEDKRRDAGFSIFYMGINLGAFLAPIIASSLIGQPINWRLGFLAVAIGMVLGLIQYRMGAKYLGDIGLHQRSGTNDEHAKQQALLKKAMMYLGIAVVLILIGHFTGIATLTITRTSNAIGVILLLIPIVYFGFLFTQGGFASDEKKRIIAIIIFFLAAALFWSAFEQAGSTLTLFADRFTNNQVFGLSFPSTLWQSVNSVWIILLSPVFALIWMSLNRMNKEPSTPLKFALGLIFVGLGYLVLVPAAMKLDAGTEKVGVMWLLSVYFLHTVGELCLSPVGLSAMTKLAPERIVGQMMGIWFLGASLGNFIGGRVGGLFESFDLKFIFLAVCGTSVFAGLVMLALVPWMKRMMGSVK